MKPPVDQQTICSTDPVKSEHSGDFKDLIAYNDDATKTDSDVKPDIKNERVKEEVKVDNVKKEVTSQEFKNEIENQCVKESTPLLFMAGIFDICQEVVSYHYPPSSNSDI